MTQDYEQEINLMDLLGYIICRWKWLVAGLILGGLIGGIVNFCTPQHVIDEKYEKANPTISEEDANGIKLLYDNFQLLQQEQKNTQEELERLRGLKEQKDQSELQQKIIEKEQLLTERTIVVSEYYTKNIRVLTGNLKAYYEDLVQGNGQVVEDSNEMQRNDFRMNLCRKSFLFGIITGVFLILLGIGVSYLLGNKVRTGEDFAEFSNSILLVDFSTVFKGRSVDFLTKWGCKLRGMNKKSAEEVMLLSSKYIGSLLAKEEVQNIYIVTDVEINSTSNLKNFKEKIKSDNLQIVIGDFLRQPEKFADMNQADGILLWIRRDQSKYNSWKIILTALNTLEKKVIGIVVE